MICKVLAVFLSLVGGSLALIWTLRSPSLDDFTVLRPVLAADVTRRQGSVVVHSPAGDDLIMSTDAFARLMANDPYWYGDRSGYKIELGRRYRGRLLGFTGIFLLACSTPFWGVVRSRSRVREAKQLGERPDGRKPG